jgi:hypothetical protein
VPNLYPGVAGDPPDSYIEHAYGTPWPIKWFGLEKWWKKQKEHDGWGKK